MSTYKSVNIFGSGPHRFSFGRQGHLVTLDYFDFGPAGGGGSTAQGPYDLDIIVTGRLVSTGDNALWTLRNAVRGQITEPPVPGILVDNAGRSWDDMTLIRYNEAPERDRGRVYSLKYVCVFRKLANL